MAGILVYSEKTRSVLELAEAARRLGEAEGRTFQALSVDRQQAAELAARGINVGQIQNSWLTAADTAAMAAALQQAAEHLKVDTILLASDRRGKELAGRLAEAWGAGCLTDVRGWVDAGGRTAWVRNALGGATLATQVINSPRRVVALCPRIFSPPEAGENGVVQPLQVEVRPSGLKLIAKRSRPDDGVDIQAAARLVIAGQGVGSPEELALAGKIAALLKAELACSKPLASDKKWLPEDRVVGLSGKTCRPDLALILGVSGQVQFCVGIREARIIISINKDENALINRMADYVLAADLNEALPRMETLLNQAREASIS